MSREHIANVLRHLREQSGLTADQVGEIVGKSGKTVNAWENNRGQPDAEMLIKLCDVYNVSDILAEFREDKITDIITLNNHEKAVVISYRNNPDLQPAVDKLLSVPKKEEKIHIMKFAARNGNNGVMAMTDSEIEELINGEKPTDI